MRKFLLNRTVQISFLILLVIGLIFLITGYTFTNNAFNVALIAVIIIYPIALLFFSQTQLWQKIVFSLIVSLLLLLSLWNLPVIIAFSNETKHTIKFWKIGSKRVLLEKRQGWAGPPYLKYQLKDYKIFGMFVKTIASGYPSSTYTDECKVTLTVNDYSNKPIYEFDSCEKKLRSINLNGK